MSSKAKQGDKKLVVSFNSESDDDEANTSSSSALSSGRDDATSSEDERLASSKRKVAFGSSSVDGGGPGQKGKKNKKGESKSHNYSASTTKGVQQDVTPANKKEQPNQAISNSSKLKSNKEQTGLVDDRSQQVAAKKSAKDEVILTSSSKATKADQLATEIDVKSATAKSSKLTSKNDMNEDVAAAATARSVLVDAPKESFEMINPEERNLAPPSKMKSKSRSKSPKDQVAEIIPEKSFSTSAEPDVLKNPSTKEVSLEERNLAPSPNKSRLKSSKNIDENVSKVLELNTGKENIATEILQNNSVNGVEEKLEKSSKKKKKQSGEGALDSEAGNSCTQNEASPRVTGIPDDMKLILGVSKTGELKENGDVFTSRAEKTSVIEDIKSNEDVSSVSNSPKNAKKSVKSNENIHTADNGVAGLEIPSAVICPESPAIKKKSKRLAAELPSASPEPSLLSKEAKPDVSIDNDAESLQLRAAATQSISKKGDELATNDFPDLLSNRITKVSSVGDSRNINEELKTTPVPDLDTLPSIKIDSHDSVEDDKQKKQSNSSLNDEVADYLSCGSSSTKSPSNTTTDEPSDQQKKQTEAPSDDKPADDETSDFSYRRQSMDDFIKKILEEAREERLKQKGGTGEATQEITGKRGESQKNRPAKDNPASVSPSDDKEISMLERRLASVEKKRLGEDKSLTALSPTPSGKLNGIDGRISPRRSDADEDTDEISRFLSARRAQRKAAEDMTDFNDAESLSSDTGSSRNRSLYGNRIREEFEEDNDSITSTKIPLLKIQPPAKKESFVARYRKERESSIPVESITPRRSAETEEIIRERTRHIRIIVDQQSDVTQSMRATARSMEELDNEIRDVRQLALDWQARIEALEGAVDHEYSAYEADQQASTERLRLQHMPDDQALREELSMAMRPPRRNSGRRGESIEDDRYSVSRRRATSVLSNGPGYKAGQDNGFDLDYLLTGGNRRDLKRAESESDFTTDRFRRGGSLTREKYVAEMLGLGDGDDYGQPSRSRGGSMRPDYASTPQPSEEVMRIRAKYSSLSNDNSAAGYNLPSRSSAGISDRGPSYLLPSSSYLSDSRSGLGSLKNDTNFSSSRYGDSSISSRYSGTGGYSTSGLSALDSSRMRRAQSVTDMSFDRPSLRSSVYSDLGTDFRSKFLTKVRDRNDDLGISSLSFGGTSLRSRDKPFKSRFLKSSSAFDSTATSNRLANSTSLSPSSGSVGNGNAKDTERAGSTGAASTPNEITE